MSTDPLRTRSKPQTPNKSDTIKSDKALTEAEIAAFSVSVQHHSSIVGWFGFGFVNIFALGNASAFFCWGCLIGN